MENQKHKKTDSKEEIPFIMVQLHRYPIFHLSASSPTLCDKEEIQWFLILIFSVQPFPMKRESKSWGRMLAYTLETHTSSTPLSRVDATAR